MNRIITISRQFGAGGRSVGKLVAEKLAEQEDLVTRIARIDEEIAVLRACLADADPSVSDDVSILP